LYQRAIEYLDAQIGLLLEELDRHGLREKTLVVVTSDNGPMHRDGSTAGLRGRIRDAYEGGIRVPLIASWPGQLPSGRVIGTPAIAYDFFPTFVKLAGGRLPEDRTYDGQDIWPLLSGVGRFEREQPFFWIYDDRVSTIRSGSWKLHVAHRTRLLPTPELYDIAKDPAETENLAAGRPEVTAQLERKIREFQAEVPRVWSLKYPVRDPAKRPSGVRRE
jgi:arylsulfatase A-like enzyme